MEIIGKVHEVSEVQQVTDTFKKREMVLQYAENPQFVEYIKFEATQDRVNIFDNLVAGEDVAVSFNLRGRPWTNKEGVTMYFNSLVAWRVNKVSNTGESAAAQPSSSHSTPPPVDISDDSGEEDDLPF